MSVSPAGLKHLAIFICALALFVVLQKAQASENIAYQDVHGLAMHDDLKYGPGFTHLEYVNPNAPKGGALRLAATGTFDSLNPYIVRGQAAAGMGMIYQTLMESTLDEPFSEYGLIAQSVTMPEDRSWVEFKLRPEARWHDGTALTAEDVAWTFETLMEKGHPFFRSYYNHVQKVEIKDAHNVRFTFDRGGNRELPLIMGQMPILPKHYWTEEGRDFARTTLEPPLGSGPYRVASVSAGSSIVFERVQDWWGADLPINKGRYNFDRISYDYYRDDTVSLQAFLAGRYDFRAENVAKSWATDYKGRAVDRGQIVKEEILHDNPTGMQAFIYNTRRPIFQDIKVREALAFAFDFEWSNRQFAYGAYKRTSSYFSNSDLASSGVPEGRELEILEDFRAVLPEHLFTTEFAVPVTDGSGRNRDQWLKAAQILDEAGYRMGRNRIRANAAGDELRFEILIQNPAFERWFNPFIANLNRIGVQANLRLVDAAQYQTRMDQFDFDMTVAVFGQSQSPGNEQRDYWGSEKASVEGSRNLIGIQNLVIDALIEKVIFAENRDELLHATRALDRVLLWNHYAIPGWHIDRYRVAYWAHLKRPDIAPKYGLGVTDTWWSTDK